MYIKGKINNKFIKFILVGILNTIVGYGLFAIFIYAGIKYPLAVLFSTILGVLFNFKSIGKLVFDSHDNSLILHFIAVYIVIYILNVSGLWTLKYFSFENMYINGFVLLAPLAIVSYVLNKNFVFERKA